ncbi:MAG: urate hydroxylase PuuD [Rhodobacteraceae bacterium]|nr:urate hydroxylase PuuD [Paracoccaceae bacterium]
MFDAAILGHWSEFALRWLHVVAAMAWIGSSFYFIALDLGLRRAPGMGATVHGEEWQVHGGGFYHIQKYLVAPDRLPDHLIWFKWESYATWLSGVALLVAVYYLGAGFYLIDPARADLPVWAAVAVSAGSLAAGWVVYDLLCRSPLGERPTLLMVLLFALIVVLAWGYAQLFTGRAALLHLGAVTATVMTANVFLVIIPNQKVVVADLRAGRQPEARFGRIAKLRSTHNNYLTLPVVFLMLSNHYPLAFATERNWMIASLVFLMGVTIRHFFNRMHAGAGRPWWTWAATAAIFLLIVWLALPVPGGAEGDARAPLAPAAARLAAAPGFAAVEEIVATRCVMCHAAEPLWPGLLWAPKGVRLDSAGAIATHARDIYLQAGESHAMPPAGLWLEPGERAVIAAWFRAGAAS